MCGIAGFVGGGTREALIRMSAAMVHRGPDGWGNYIEEESRVFLAHRRLAIVDLETGAQPMSDVTGRVTVVFNGEIYNHLELRKKLEAKGYRFRSNHSDTEVLVHGWIEWGSSLPEKLNGMFAFAIWDAKLKCLFLARDRFGEKPIYWSKQGDAFIFASELTALAQHPCIENVPDRTALKKFFCYGFVPAPHAYLKGTMKIPAGGWVKYDIHDGRVTEARYWRFRIEPEEPTISEDDLADELRALLIQATERRLMADVSLGLFLSGGIDSSIIVACAAENRHAAEINTFAIGFTEQSFDESAFAQAAAAHFGTLHRFRILDLEMSKKLIPEVLRQLDEPLGDASILPTYLLSQFTREHVKVALSGDGGDELFAGYDQFAAIGPAQLYQSVVPRQMHRMFKRLIDLLPISDRNMSLEFKIRRTLAGLDHGPELWNPTWMASVSNAELTELFLEPTNFEEIFSDAIELWKGSEHLSFVDRTLEFFTNFYLQDDILFKVDRASMAHGLEVRSVFLDPDLVEFVRRLPARYKLRNGQRKYLLKKAFARDLPKAILNRPKKGFGVPLNKWLRELPVQTDATHTLNLNAAMIQRAANEHCNRLRDHRFLLWSHIVLEGMANLPRDTRFRQ